MPEPTLPNNISRDDAINQIISSIAQEEIGLSNVLNAEGDKLKYVLGTLEGVTGPVDVTFEQIMQTNESIQSLLEVTAVYQMHLRGKMTDAIRSVIITGATGPSGMTGAAGEQGAIGAASSSAYGTFVGFDEGTYSGGAENSGVILPVDTISEDTLSDAFTLNNDGSVYIAESGTYQAVARVQFAASTDLKTFALQVNGEGANDGGDNTASASSTNEGDAMISTILQLTAGDEISMSLISPSEVTLSTNPGDTPTGTPTVTITLVKLD